LYAETEICAMKSDYRAIWRPPGSTTRGFSK
jgi:hypothetical protein